MRIVILRITKKSASGDAFKESRIQVDELHIGRGSDQQLCLGDLHAALEHAVLKPGRGRKFIVTSSSHAGIRANGETCQLAEVYFGDTITIGNTDIQLKRPPKGADLTLVVNEAGAAEAAAARTTRVNLADTGLRRRPIAWTGFLLVALLAFGLPHFAASNRTESNAASMAEPLLDTWSSGPLSKIHDGLPGNCKACHDRPFERVKDAACLDCHAGIEAHIALDPDAQAGSHADDILSRHPGETNCTSCHIEHEGDAGVMQMAESLCVDCHADPERGMTPGRHGSGITKFADDHPDFRLHMLYPAGDGWEVERVEFSAGLREESGLKFPHDAHMDPAGIRGPEDTEVLACESCHQLEAAGIDMRPITMERDCQRCHELTFDPFVPSRSLPHGDVFAVQAMLREFYARIALQGGYPSETAPAVVTERRAPGKTLEREATRAALEWSERKAAEVATDVFERRVCSNCHEVRQVIDQWRVAPARLNRAWMPASEFSHADHEEADCSDCHAAGQSSSSTDVLMPHIESCTDCHDDRPGEALVRSECQDCHGFHSVMPALPVGGDW